MKKLKHFPKIKLKNNKKLDLNPPTGEIKVFSRSKNNLIMKEKIFFFVILLPLISDFIKNAKVVGCKSHYEFR